MTTPHRDTLAPAPPHPLGAPATSLPDTPPVRALGLPRLTAGFDDAERLGRTAHLLAHGSLPALTHSGLATLAEDITLRGRGGAGFPFVRKLEAVARQVRRTGTPPAVVVNGCEGEPACRKDTVLLCRAPHLVLDGALLAAEALGARTLVVGVTKDTAEASLRAAMAERGLKERRRGRALRARLVRLPERFVSGEASALIRAADGGPPLPPGRRTRAAEAGLGGAPTLVSNTETFAQLAVAARLGARHYAATGTAEEPGTLLLTVSGAVPSPTVVEAPSGVPLGYILQSCAADPSPTGVLVGGYHGAWLDAASAYEAVVTRDALAARGGALGAGAVLPLPADACPLGETLRVAHWLAAESAGQCGPCRLGLPSLAGALAGTLAGGREALEAVRQAAQGVRGRGACKHPDGSARFVLSALTAFTDDLAAHVLGGGCGRETIGVLPLSAPEADGTRDGQGAGGRLAVDWTLCEGHGLCAGLLPEAVRLDGDGYPVVADAPLPGRLRTRAQRAVRRCPALALRLEDR
ncbi:NADH-ubiquinone oxidoreductase-F iron-sulfur binding region domain-containing protein [Streptomyces sp. NPDC003077]|uniref:NADH-ubiquinone oxidoreductase-F iron-sulfur binding region domain-containing protein n=1 Tax=Streptomyces sp. NPDC003077 TaxID=3154443 RepID=UPI0033A4AD05